MFYVGKNEANCSLLYPYDTLPGCQKMPRISGVASKPRIILASPIRVQTRRFFYFGIGIGSQTNDSKNHVESLKVTSTQFFATLRDSMQFQKLRIGLDWSCTESNRLAWDRQQKKIGQILYLSSSISLVIFLSFGNL